MASDRATTKPTMTLTDPSVSAGSAERDEVLAVRLRDGDAGAGDELVRRYTPVLLRHLHRLTGDNHVAEELLQQTWLSVLDHLDRFDPKVAGGFKAWLFRIAINKANDQWRSRGRERAAHEGLRLIRGDEALPDASQRIEAGEQEQKLRRAIAKLPEPQRQVLFLRYYGGLKFIEIAQTLGCPLNTALGRMHKAIRKLKQLMDN